MCWQTEWCHTWVCAWHLKSALFWCSLQLEEEPMSSFGAPGTVTTLIHVNLHSIRWKLLEDSSMSSSRLEEVGLSEYYWHFWGKYQVLYISVGNIMIILHNRQTQLWTLERLDVLLLLFCCWCFLIHPKVHTTLYFILFYKAFLVLSTQVLRWG